MPSTSSAWRPSIAASKRAKLAALAAIAGKEPNFFVRVFGGYFPIPSRYELAAYGATEVLLARRRGGRSGSLGYRIFHIPAGDAYESTDAVVQIHGEAGRQCLTITGDRSGFWRESLAEFRKIDALMNEAGGK